MLSPEQIAARKGKLTATPGFVAAYMEAWHKMVETGEPQPIVGFPGWKVMKLKEEDALT